MSDDLITYEVKDRAAVITLNNPKKLNALSIPQYDTICKLLERANAEEDTVITLLQSTGRVFSAGANADSIVGQDAELETWLNMSVAKQTFLVQTFLAHKKILAVALNGPVIGLSAAFVALCDLVYVHNAAKTFFLTPFANIGILAEGGTSATLPMRVGWSRAAEALLLSKRISGDDLQRAGFFNKDYKGQFKSAEEFNEVVLKELLDATENLHEDSIIQNKELLKAIFKPKISEVNSQEVSRGVYKWTSGVPMDRFKKLLTGELKHKL
ncbi:3,2-trans-enoyl-CoA isomerase [Candida viswanathii]|uniref:3,2-trans-enoyl-CoA isomerase n=1 Tax=Candida viswanathii TaxID=5486 RepID=A0A367YCC1_9ASCO|nr:3,2-trans-enoyl-CoA isomerase [Candida viswanathii]